MEILNNKLNLLKEKINNGKLIKVAIIGLGSVGNYLLNYLNKWEEITNFPKEMNYFIKYLIRK